MLGNVAATLPYLGTRASAAGDLMANEPRPYNATDKFVSDLVEQFDAETDGKYGIFANKVVPEGSAFDRYSDAFQNGGRIASVAPVAKDGVDYAYKINYNPNANAAYFAHELGHAASEQDGFGKLVSEMRGDPGLAKVLKHAAYLSPGAVAALLPGDNDLAASIAAAAIMDSPIILDEALASMKGFDLMDKAGYAPRAGQRARMAGALMNYIGGSAVKGAIANAAGNLMDDELVGPA